MRKFYMPDKGCMKLLSAIFICLLYYTSISAQCSPTSGSLTGAVYEDGNNNGSLDPGEIVMSGVDVVVHNQDGDVLGTTTTGPNGQYTIDDLQDGEDVRIDFDFDDQIYTESRLEDENFSAVQFATIPACGRDLHLSYIDPGCEVSPDLYLTCFVRGEVDNPVSSAGVAIVGIPARYTGGEDAFGVASHGDVGSVWGIAYKESTQELFSAAFVKQYAGLKASHSTIFRTVPADGGGYRSEPYVDLTDLGVDVAPLLEEDVTDCAYGEQVGKYGLGALVLNQRGDQMFVVNISENQVVQLPVVGPTASNTVTYDVPDPGCGAYRTFALEWYNGRLYVGLTCTQENSPASATEKDQASSAVIYSLDVESGEFRHEFTTDYIKGHWGDFVSNTARVTHWLTDISFNRDGNMILGISDRKGHSFCNDQDGVLHGQAPDILMVYREDESWVLESNGRAGRFTGSGVDNGEGPDGGEFFGDDFWPARPDAHSEVALGSVFAVPGSDLVVATVFDPDQLSYSGGLHTYSARDGSLLNNVELYSYSIDVNFGKATGFGGITSTCTPLPIQIGNYVWDDTDGDGIQDAGEAPVPNLNLVLYNALGEEVGNTTTNDQGQYTFNIYNYSYADLDGDIASTEYYISIPFSQFDPVSWLVNVDDVTYATTISGVSSHVGSDAFLDFSEDFGDHPVELIVPISIPNIGTNDFAFDIGLNSNLFFDLALQKRVVSNPYVSAGDIVDFEIEVYNQGTIPATNVEVTDYLPSSMVLVEGQNSGWSEENGVLKYTIPGPIHPNESTVVPLTLQLSGSGTDYVNVAEISDATDPDGNHPDDEDSDFDDDADNDTGGEWDSDNDDEIMDDGTADEDDHDPAGVHVFDLALRYQLVGDPRRNAGETVEFEVTVYNQGNITANEYEVAVYQSEDLDFNSALSTAWTNTGGYYHLVETKDLLPGQSQSFRVFFDISADTELSQLVQWAEIMNAVPTTTATIMDFDSTPDTDPDNDTGGEVFTTTDDLITDHGQLDEDDHDPAVVIIDVVDLALTKRAHQSIAQPGDLATFEIEVMNQGSVPVTYIDLVDYLPQGLLLADSEWTNDGDGLASRTIEVEGGLGYRQSVITTITTRVSADAPSTMINYAEISDFRDENHNSLSQFDIDSDADRDPHNDVGGTPNSIYDDNITARPADDEDDHDPAMLLSGTISLEDEMCLANATTPHDGLFSVSFEFTSQEGATWEVVSASNIYQDGSTPGSLTPLFDPAESNVTFTEESIGGGMSTYSLSAIYQDAQDYSFEVSDGTATLNYNGTAQSYTDLVISGERSLCSGVTATYTASGLSTTDYMWILPAEATLLSGAGTNTIEVQWQDITGGPFEVAVQSADPTLCVAPGSIDVSLGAGGATISCFGNLNVSLNQDCMFEVTPQSISSIPVDPNAGFSVMLLHNEEAIPGNILTDIHIGKEIHAKLIDGCGSNTCWTSITVEDKLPPVVQVPDSVFVECTEATTYMPVALDNCNNPVSDVVETFRTETPLHCDPDFVMRVDVAYVATDLYGNQSDPVSTVIMVRRPDLNTVMFPDNLMGPTTMVCGTFETDEDGFPLLEETGYPRLNGIDLVPGIDLGICNIGVSSTIRRMGSIGCVTKYAREFTVYEAWCSNGVLLQHTQIIEVEDLEPPVFDNVPEDFSALANSATCMASVLLPEVTATDGCLGDAADIQVSVNDVLNNNTVVNLPIGLNKITYYAIDACNRRSSIEVLVDVDYIDGPTVVCDQETVVALNEQGFAYAYASTFDDGSTAGCGHIDSMKVRRMGDDDPCGLNDEAYADFVEFCCEEVGDTVMVELTVWDDSGNSNNCMVLVYVQDDVPPVISCPADVTISCLDDISDLSVYGMATAVDSCQSVVEELDPIMDLDACGVGTITRRFRASDQSNSVTCDQTITIQYQNPYTFDVDDLPADFDTMLCEIEELRPEDLPDGFGFPEINAQGTCSNVGVNYTDRVITTFPADSTILFKILRTWTIVDSCSNNPDFIVFQGDQTIKVQDQEVCDFMDLALIKQLNTDATQLPVTIGDQVTFDITVCNQGNTVVEEVEIVDYLPEGLTLDDSDWTLNGDMATQLLTPGNGLPAGGLQPDGDSCVVTSITMLLNNAAAPSTVLNYAEIKAAINVEGETEDFDSTPDMDPNNDGTVFPGDPHDDSFDGDVDEDDFDVADVPLFDLALRKTVASSGPFDLGDQVTFDITVFNQGNVGATNVEIIDYVPCGFMLAQSPSIWTADPNSSAVTTVINDLPAAGEITVSIDLVVIPCTDDMAYVNEAEIVSALDADGNATADIDSEADSNADNDSGGVPESNTDNTVNNENGDEDDADPASIGIEYCDICPGLDIQPIDDIVVDADMGQCESDLTIPVPDVVANPCNEVFQLTFTTRYENGPVVPGTGDDASGIYQAGNTVVTYELVSECATVTESFTVTVEDAEGPVCNPDPIVHPPLTITNDMPVAMLDTQFLINQFTDVCGTVDPDFIIVSQGEFDCDDSQVSSVQFDVTVRDTNGNETTCTASVVVNEMIAPVCNPQDVTIYLDNSGEVVISPTEIVPQPMDACGNSTIVEVSPPRFDCSNIGDNTVMVTITDNNGNSSPECQATVTVLDTISPVCNVVDITVSLVGNSVEVEFDDIDAGSFDNCVDFTATPNLWDFDCEDIGDTTVTVTLMDSSGNSSSCEATITIEDNTMVECIALDTTIYLDEDGIAAVSPDLIDGGSSFGCAGDPSTSVFPNFFGCQNTNGVEVVTLYLINGNDTLSSCQANVTIVDTLTPMVSIDPVVDIECDDFDINDLPAFVAEDNCGTFEPVTITETLDSTGLNVCGIGSLVRTITVTDGSGNDTTVVQTINITNIDNPFTINNITFPPADTMVTCDVNGLPDAGTVEIDTTGIPCSLVSVTDTSYFSNSGSCPDTLVKTWNIIDSCQFDGVFDLNGPGEYQFTQRIAIVDETGPDIDFPLAAPGDTLVFYVDTLPCELFVSLGATVSDCSPIDTVFNDSPFADDSSSASADGTYPVGDHNITITARDECQNESTYSYVVSVRDTTAFDVFCTKRFYDIPDTLTVPVPARDFIFVNDAGCKDSTRIDAYYSLDTTDAVRDATCAMLGDSSFWVIIYVDGQFFDSCKTLITVSDPNMFCGSSTLMASVEGDVNTVNGEPLSNTYVELLGGGVDDMTDQQGHYRFSDMPTGGDYIVKPVKDEDHFAGISTLDLILIQRHILGISAFQNPYDFLAADVNASESISGADVVELRRLVLGVTDRFENNTSWRMVDAYQTFEFPENILWEAKEDKLLANLQNDVIADFTAVKVGDVNGSVTTGLNSDDDLDSRSAIWLDTEINKGVISVKATRDLDLRGLQLSLEIDGLQDLTSSSLDMDDSNYFYDGGVLNLSWTEVQGQQIEEGQTLFTIQQDVDQVTRSIMVADRMASEVYLGNDLEVLPVRLRTAPGTPEMQLLQNAPNPWSDVTEIGVVVGTTSEVSIVVSDLTGKTVKTMSQTCYPGLNKVNLYRGDIPASGVYYYTVTDGTSTITQKMIVLQ